MLLSLMNEYVFELAFRQHHFDLFFHEIVLLSPQIGDDGFSAIQSEQGKEVERRQQAFDERVPHLDVHRLPKGIVPPIETVIPTSKSCQDDCCLKMHQLLSENASLFSF